MDDTMIIVMFTGIGLLFIWYFWYVTAQRQQLKRYEQVTIGMSEEEMLQIMGKGYNKSSLKNNRFKYEWRINATSAKNGFGGRMYSGVKKVDIYICDGLVEEIRPYNV